MDITIGPWSHAQNVEVTNPRVGRSTVEAPWNWGPLD
jgi:hypothetical protein